MIFVCFQSSKESDTYTAAVVEFHRSRKSLFDAISDNLEEYLDFISKAKIEVVIIYIWKSHNSLRITINYFWTQQTTNIR